MTWLTKLTGRSHDGSESLRNPEGLTPDAIEAIRLALPSPKLIGVTEARALLAYVVDDIDEPGMERLIDGFTAGVTAALSSPDAAAQRLAFFGCAAEMPPAVLFRFVAVLKRLQRDGMQRTASIGVARAWIDLLLLDAASLSHAFFGAKRGHSKLPENVSLIAYEKLLPHGGLEADYFVRTMLTRGDPYFRIGYIVESAHDAHLSLLRHADTVRTFLAAPDADDRAFAFDVIAALSPEVGRAFLPEIARALVAPSKKVRAACAAFVNPDLGPALVPALRSFANGKSEERKHALVTLARLADRLSDAELAAFVREASERDSSPAVREAVAAVLPTSEQREARAEALPPLPTLSPPRPLPSSARESFERFFRESDRLRSAQHERYVASNPLSAARQRNVRLIAPVADVFWPYISGQTDVPPTADAAGNIGSLLSRDFYSFFRMPEIELTHVVRCGRVLSGIISGYGNGFSWGFRQMLDAAAAGGMRADLVELAVALEPECLPGGFSGLAYLSISAPFWRSCGVGVALPYFVRKPDVLVAIVSATGADIARTYDIPLTYRVIGALPALPASLAACVYEAALGLSKTHATHARAALQAHPERSSRIAQALKASRAETRTAAAEWLASLDDRSAIPLLLESLEREKNDAAAAAMMIALERMNVPLDRFISRTKLQAEAELGVAKGRPEGLSWLPWDHLPIVRWADSGEPVGATIIEWLIVQAYKLKSPVPSPFLRRYAQQFDPESRAALARSIVSGWIAADLIPITPKEAHEKAMDEARGWYQTFHGPYGSSFQQHPWFQKSADEMCSLLLPDALQTPRGSEASSRGVLAVAAACGGADIAPLAFRYIKERYGTRLAQSKALTVMLGWTEDRAATQALLAIANRFRTKAIQEEAARLAEDLAERNGWTVDELADRTVPTAGFDETRTFELDFGERTFTARLTDDLEIALFAADGARLPKLPVARKDDDEAKANDAKASLSAAAKQLKSIVSMQMARLREALCTQRAWTFADWRDFLLAHPIMGLLAARVVWIARRGDSIVAFRPLTDGTLIDAGDETVTIEPDAIVRVAHDLTLPPGSATEWLRHLSDYEVATLFPQLGRRAFVLAPERASDLTFDEIKGHMLEAFTLRAQATKLGYVRGVSEDGGVFMEYRKPFRSLGITAVVAFSGNTLPEENRRIALHELHFERDSSDDTPRGSVPLGDVPPILLAECVDDARSIARLGPGFDPNWEHVW